MDLRNMHRESPEECTWCALVVFGIMVLAGMGLVWLVEWIF